MIHLKYFFMKKLYLFFVLLSASWAFRVELMAQGALQSSDIQLVVGSWQGVLSYLDYTSNKLTHIQACIDIQQIGRSNAFILKNTFPKEPHVYWSDTLKISKDGKMLNNEVVESKNILQNGDIEIVTTSSGKDGNDQKPANFRFTYILGKNKFIKRKDVQFEGEKTWLQRHEYNYQERAKYLTPKQMKYDLDIIKSTWENVHVGLYRYNSKAQIESYFQEIYELIKAPMEQRQFFILLSQLNIKIRCGHTFVSYYNNKRVIKNNLYSSVYLPFLFQVIDNQFVITHNLSENPAVQVGDEIVAINGIQTKTIIDSLLTVSKSDGENGLNKQLDNITIYPKSLNMNDYCLFDIFFPLFFKKDINEPNYTLDILSKKKKTKITCQGLSKNARLELFTERYGKIPKNEESWYVKPIDKHTVLFRLGNFTTYNWKFDFNKYLDSIFVHINQAGYQNLIVDIRQNEGGTDDARDAVLSYLTSHAIEGVTTKRLYRYQSIPDSLLAYLDTWDEGFKKAKKDYVLNKEGFYEHKNPKTTSKVIPSNPNHFKGKIYLITDVTNSSATFTMADIFKRNKLGTIVGEKTGGSQQGINGGEIFFLYLPNSEMEMDIPLIYQAPITPRKDEGILPNFEIKTTKNDILNSKDAQIQFITKKLVK